MAITQIEAQELLLALTVGDYPTAKQEYRARIHRQFYRLAYPKIESDVEKLTIEELAERLKGAINV